jgi:hypothetical protein
MPGNDPRLVALVAHLDREDASAAETWRRVGDAVAAIGLQRPSYECIRRLVRIERRRRELRREGRRVVGGAVGAAAVGLVPNVQLTLERVSELRGLEELVTQRYKALPDEWETEDD